MFEDNLDEKEGQQTQQLAPNNTLYINNLNEKVPIDELKDTLFEMFEEYGEILDIVAKRNIRMRGQAFIVFEQMNSAMDARRKLNGSELYGKTMKICFARQKSDIIAKRDGTFNIRERPENYFQIKFEQKFVRRPQNVRAKVEREKNIGRKFEKSQNVPNHILFCQGLDASITKQLLQAHFMRCPGLKDVRLAPKNYAFIEYENEFQASSALSSLNGLEIQNCTLQLSYAKK